MKPFNFLLTCYVKQFGYPLGVNPERFHLVAPYELDPSRWLEMPWIDQYTGKPYQITTVGFHANRQAARVKTYGDVLREYEFHPGSKSADAKGKPSGKQTTGLLQRPPELARAIRGEVSTVFAGAWRVASAVTPAPPERARAAGRIQSRAP